MKDKAAVLNDIVYTCSKCSQISLLEIGSDAHQCAECESEEDASGNSDNFAALIIGLAGWFALLLLL